MQVGTRVRYALRAVFDMAYHGNGGPVTVGAISRRQGISTRYLEQILHKLTRAGLVGSKRGPKGGYFLSKAPEALSVHDLVLATEGPLALVPCLECDENPGAGGSEPACPLAGRCPARLVWAEAGRRIGEIFGRATIQDLCDRAERRGLLRGGAP
jgi:Rrf2 family protein